MCVCEGACSEESFGVGAFRDEDIGPLECLEETRQQRERERDCCQRKSC